MFTKVYTESELCKYIFHLFLKLSKLQSKKYPYFHDSTEVRNTGEVMILLGTRSQPADK